MKTQEYLLESVQWLKDHNEPIPPDLLSQLKKSGIVVDGMVNNTDTLENLKKEIEVVRKKVDATPITKEDFASLMNVIVEAIRAMPAPKVTVAAPTQRGPKIAREIQKINRDAEGYITSTETQIIYE